MPDNPVHGYLEVFHLSREVIQTSLTAAAALLCHDGKLTIGKTSGNQLRKKGYARQARSWTKKIILADTSGTVKD